VASALRLTATQDTLELSTDANGKFECRLEELPAYTVSATANGFMPRQIQIALPALVRDTTIFVEIPLTPIDRKQVLTINTFNKKTSQRMDANVLISLKDEAGTTMSLRSEGGTLKADITREGWHMIVASEEGFLSANDSLWVPALDKALAAKSLYLQPIEVGTTVRLRNVYFDFDKTTLKSESFTELNKVVDFLSKNPTVEIEIAGHTDSKGSDDYNRNLSQGRCQSVVDYLVSQGIESYRLTPRGYGESEPIDTNDTDAGRANNRRVELKVLKM
jgi:outer membrane protein OmpA-like peptidoglycan-associated protein